MFRNIILFLNAYRNIYKKNIKLHNIKLIKTGETFIAYSELQLL